MRYKKITQYRRTKGEIWEFFSPSQIIPFDTGKFVQLVIEKAQTKFEQYNKEYADLKTKEAIDGYKELDKNLVKFFSVFDDFRSCYKHEIARSKVGGKPPSEFLGKIEKLDRLVWKNWIEISYPDIAYKIREKEYAA